MSNFKEIEGLFINLDLVEEMAPASVTYENGTKEYRIGFFMITGNIHEKWVRGEKIYKTNEEAEDRIREIIKNQDRPITNEMVETRTNKRREKINCSFCADKNVEGVEIPTQSHSAQVGTRVAPVYICTKCWKKSEN